MFLLQPPEERLGLSDMPLTLGGVRSLTPAVQLDETHSLLGFPTLLAVRHLGLDPSAQKWLLGGREVARADGPIEIAFAGPPGTVPTIPLWRLIEPGALTAADRDLLDGRVAIIGAADPTSLDRVPVPYTLAGLAYGGDMYGAEVHAQALHTLLSGERVTRPDRLMSALIVLLAGLASGVAFAHSRFRAALLGLGVAALAWPAAGAAAFVGARIALPVASGLAASLYAFGGAYVLRYATEERERRRIRSLFERYVSDDVVEELLGSDAALQLGGTRREVTILFCDVVGFTSLSERLSAEEVVELVNVYLASMCAPILEHGGHVDKFAGDGIMAVFGAPALHPDHADRAVRAALAMSAAVPAVAAWVTERFADRELAPFDIGIGLHTGTPVAGNIGFERRTEYTVIGDDVNVAARIEGLTRTVGCRILASRHVVRAARDELPLGRRALLPVKGRREPVEVVELLAEPRETSP